MIAVFQNLTFLDRPFFNNAEYHILDLMGYVDANDAAEAVGIWRNRAAVKQKEKITPLMPEPLEKLPDLQVADILLTEDKPWIITPDGFRELDQKAFSQRKPTSGAEFMHRYMPFQLTLDLFYDFGEFIMDQYEVCMLDQVHEDMFLEWQEELREKKV